MHRRDALVALEFVTVVGFVAVAKLLIMKICIWHKFKLNVLLGIRPALFSIINISSVLTTLPSVNWKIPQWGDHTCSE